MLFIICFIIGTLSLLLLKLKLKKKKGNFPPGPKGLPLIGNLHQLICKNPYQKFSDWAKQYGKIYTIEVATKKAFVVNDPKTMKDVFGHFASTGKFKTEMFLVMTRGPYGVLSTEGRDSLEQRAFLMKNLKRFGLSNRTMEPLLLQEFQELIEWIKTENKKCGENEGLILNEVILLTGLNGLWTMVNGQRISLENSEMANLIKVSGKSIINTMKTGLIVFPWLKYVAPSWSGYNRLMSSTGKALDYLKDCIAEHTRTFTPSAPRDLIDCYVEEMNDAKNGEASPFFYGPTAMAHTLGTLVTVLSAGSDTTSNILISLLFYLTQHSEIQKKLHQEIDKVIGRDRNPSLTDKPKMLYIDAVIHEVLRYSSVAPIGVIHQLLDDVEFEGYSMPKDSLLISNMFHVHYDKNIWGDPENFRPERFLEAGNETLKESVVPFQPGRRSCPGEFLAKDTLFLFASKMLQSFEVRADPSVPAYEYMEPEVTYTLAPKQLKVIMKPRF